MDSSIISKNIKRMQLIEKCDEIINLFEYYDNKISNIINQIEEKKEEYNTAIKQKCIIDAINLKCLNPRIKLHVLEKWYLFKNSIPYPTYIIFEKIINFKSINPFFMNIKEFTGKSIKEIIKILISYDGIILNKITKLYKMCSALKDIIVKITDVKNKLENIFDNNYLINSIDIICIEHVIELINSFSSTYNINEISLILDYLNINDYTNIIFKVLEKLCFNEDYLEKCGFNLSDDIIFECAEKYANFLNLVVQTLFNDKNITGYQNETIVICREIDSNVNSLNDLLLGFNKKIKMININKNLELIKNICDLLNTSSCT
jgi:hypothetical protein